MGKKILGFLIACLVFALTLFGLLLLLEKQQDHSSTSPQVSFEFERISDLSKIKNHEEVGFSGNTKVHAKKIIGKEKVYETTYFMDDYGLREIPSERGKKGDKFLIINGCSYSFGEGLEVESTLTAMLSRKYHETRFYNMSFMGGGLHTALRYLDLVDVKELVREPKGQILYIFINNHLDRWFLRANYLSWASEFAPHYVVKEDEVLYEGRLSAQEKYKVFHGLSATGLKDSALKMATMLDGKEKDVWSREEFHEFVVAIRSLKDRYKTLFPQSQFAVVIHPNAGLIGENHEMFMTELKKANLEVWDLEAIHRERVIRDKLNWHSFEIPLDGHPNKLMNEEFVKYLKPFLKTADRNLK